MPGRPVIFQAKAPLSVGYKAVLVHEFARPPKFALWLLRHNWTFVFGQGNLKTIPYLIETFVSWFVYFVTWSCDPTFSPDFSFSLLRQIAQTRKLSCDFYLLLLRHLSCQRTFYVSFCSDICPGRLTPLPGERHFWFDDIMQNKTHTLDMAFV